MLSIVYYGKIEYKEYILHVK